MKRISRRTEEEDSNLKNLGIRIRKMRELKGFTQEEFARVCGFSRSYFTEIETGKRNITFLNLLRIINTLEVDVNELIEFDK
jgi:transcriptional regulator with XRE-family HTH domain